MTVYVSVSSPTPGQQIGTTAAFDVVFSASTDSPGGVLVNNARVIFFDTNTSGAQTYNSGPLTGGGTSKSWTVTVPANTLTAGKTYVVRHSASDNTGQTSWVDVTVSAVGATVTPTITVPAAAAVISAPSSTVTWTLANGNTQYQVQVLNGATVVFDTGEITSTAQTVTDVPFPDNGVSRAVRVRAKRSAAYAWSAWATVSVTVAHTPPVTPTITTLAAQDTGSIGVLHTLVVGISQPTPGGGVPATATTELYVRPNGDTSDGVLIYTVAAIATSYTWRAPTSGITYQMRVRNVSADGRYAYSAWYTATSVASIVGVVLLSTAAVTAPLLLRFNGDEASDDYQPQAELIQYDGRALPVVEFGTSSTRELKVSVSVKTPAERDALRTILLSRSVMLYRDRRARKMFALITAGPFVDTIYGTTTELTVTAVDYAPDRSA